MRKLKNKCIFKILYRLYKNLYRLYKKEIKFLREQNSKLDHESWKYYYYVSCVKTNYEGARGAMENILKTKTVKEAKYYAKIGLMYMTMRGDTIYKKPEGNEDD